MDISPDKQKIGQIFGNTTTYNVDNQTVEYQLGKVLEVI